MDLLLTFSASLGLALALSFAVGEVMEQIKPRWPRLSQALTGLLFGLMAVLFIRLPFEVQPGVLVDLRNLVVFLAGPFGGPLGAAIAAGLAGGYRLYLGGAGALSGTGAILTAALLGGAIGWKHGRLATWRSAALGGAALFALCMPWFLAIGDLGFGWSLLQRFALPYAIFFIGGSVLLSALLMADLRRRSAEKLVAFNEQRFRDIAEMASDWFWEMDENLRITYVSHRLREITGYGAEYFQGKRRRDLAAQVPKAGFEAHEQALKQRKPFRDFSYDIQTADGSARQVLISGKPIFDETGRFLGYRGSGRDISAECRYRREMEAARLNAELANKAKSDFLASMSHELRTPLNAIIGFSEIMKNEMFGKHSVQSYKEYAADINSSAEYLLSLVNDVLDVARVESGRMVLEKSPCELEAVILSSLRLVEERASRSGIRLTTEIQPGMPMAHIDERAIKQVIVNVVTNAVKFTKSGGSIAINARFDSSDGYEITVSDTGIGIDASELTAVLEPFHQLANGKRINQEGTGLGLTLSKALVEGHGGSFALNSAPGRGTTVRITLPLAAAAARRKAAASRADTPLAN